MSSYWLVMSSTYCSAYTAAATDNSTPPLYRIAIVQQRHHPAAKTYLAKKIAEGKTAREARRALKRHLANVLYRRLLDWANHTPAMNLLT